jgi:hypothetical protein
LSISAWRTIPEAESTLLALPALAKGGFQIIGPPGRDQDGRLAQAEVSYQSSFTTAPP